MECRQGWTQSSWDRYVLTFGLGEQMQLLTVVAEAAEEDRQAGKKRITPYWRTIKDDGKLNEKFPGGVRAQAAKLRQEGFTIQPGKGKQPPKVFPTSPLRTTRDRFRITWLSSSLMSIRDDT